MKIAILSRSRSCYSTRRLVEAAKNQGLGAKVYDTTKFAISLEQEEPELYYGARRFPLVDGIIPRVGASITFFGTAVVRQFEQMGVYSANSSIGISNSRDKLRSLQMLSRHNIGIPLTEFVRSRADILPAISRVGGAPVVIKLIEGTQGVGVILAETEQVAQAIVETLQQTRQNVLIQKFVAESRGRDIRAFVVGKQVVGAMRRVAQGEEFRSNVHRGGRVEKINLDPQFEETAIRAAGLMGLQVAGVDMLESDDGPVIMEVNSSPGLEGIEEATQKDIAGSIIEHMKSNIRYPELDLKTRLTLDRGYSVLEFQIGEKTGLAGKTVKDTGLREKDIIILSVSRNGKVIPNPKAARVLEAHDVLLAFGKTESLGTLISDRVERTRNRRKRKK